MRKREGREHGQEVARKNITFYSTVNIAVE